MASKPELDPQTNTVGEYSRKKPSVLCCAEVVREECVVTVLTGWVYYVKSSQSGLYHAFLKLGEGGKRLDPST